LAPSTAPEEIMTDTLITMREDLARALAKPASERRWAMVIDTRKCVGCHACTIACVSEHKLPPEVSYRPVAVQEAGAYPNVTTTFRPRPCRQCDVPKCVAPCPASATWKETAGIAAGTVVIDYGKCIGCGKCFRACPYDARSLDDGGFYHDARQRQPWEMAKFWEYGRSWTRTKRDSPIGKARKCHWCTDRLAQGVLPACVTSCIGRATYFGDESDPASLVSLVKQSNPIQTLDVAGTLPRVGYIAREQLEVTP
jgi:molybdopterin-containing oxidoreductase family iron-sulfur binding subunit